MRIINSDKLGRNYDDLYLNVTFWDTWYIPAAAEGV